MCPSTLKNEILIGKEYTKELLASIDSAHKNIYIFMYDWRWYKNDFSCDMSLINQALVRATRRGVLVTAILNSPDIIETLRGLGINAIKLNQKKLMHAKAIVIDEWVTFVGSHNFSEMAMGLNVEITQKSEDEYIAKKIITYFMSLFL
jgi:phosphatidylserine/phosphatidylglycerophosphate/cardiolipin synthase-like enzyme